MIGLLAALALGQAPTSLLDDGTLVIRVDTQEVARERFRLVSRRGRDGSSGWMLAATARWVVDGRPTVFAPVIEVTPDSEPAALAYDVSAGGASLRITGQPNTGRYTLRYVGPGIERARELAVRPPVVVLDDSVFAPLLFVAWRASPAPAARSVHAIFPRAPRSAVLTVTDLGVAATTLNRESASLRHVVVSGGADGPIHVWLSDAGYMMKVEIPKLSLNAERLPD
ncbi:MAG TPA: hypothetical protein VH833_02510 [Gemmatimonadales bacterium]|jgi:hypothetical protein